MNRLRPTPANLYTTHRVGLSHWQDPQSHTLFSQGKYPTKITVLNLPPCFLSGVYYGVYGYLRTNKVKGLWYKPCHHTNHMFKDDFLFISYQHPVSSCPLFDIYTTPDTKYFDEVISGGMIPHFLRYAEHYSLCNVDSIWSQIEEKRSWLKVNYPADYRREVLIPDTETYSSYYHKVKIF